MTVNLETHPFTITPERRARIIEKFHKLYPITIDSENHTDYIFFRGRTVDQGDFICREINFEQELFYVARPSDIENVNTYTFIIIRKKDKTKINTSPESNREVRVGENKIHKQVLGNSAARITLLIDGMSIPISVLHGRVHMPLLKNQIDDRVKSDRVGQQQITMQIVKDRKLTYYQRVLNFLNPTDQIILAVENKVYCVSVEKMKELSKITNSLLLIESEAEIYLSDIKEFENPPF